MEARIVRAAAVWAVLLVSMGASYRTPNFVIQTGDPRLAAQFGKAAEKYRHELALAWLGKPMPEWSQPCVVTARVGPGLGAGGETSFVFDRGEVFGWRMTIQGSAQRILDSVLPHEITHMILACRFRQPLPRWADEGAATSVEHPQERAKHYKMLVEFLQNNRGIAFNRMFAMERYPRDMLPLYAQGYTLTEFLIQHGGRRKFLEFLAEGMRSGQWSAATSRHYDLASVGALQNAWLGWVRQGFPRIQRPTDTRGKSAEPEMLAAGGRRPRPEPNLIYRVGKRDRDVSTPGTPASVKTADQGGPGADVLTVRAEPPSAGGFSPASVVPTSGWRARGEGSGGARAAVAPGPSSAGPVRAHLAHPQPIGRPRQIILEWSRR